MSRWSIRAAAGLALALSACSSPPRSSEVAGDCADAFGGDVCTWAMMTGEAVTEVGVTVPMASIEGAPADDPFTWPPPTAAVVAMPAAASPSGVSHITFDWNAVGHPPPTYLTPHFDVHFYFVPQTERMAIDCSRTEKATDLPAGYVLPDEAVPPELQELIGVPTLVGLCVPQMGMHALVSAEMANPDPFEETMIVGYYGGAPIFLEPMVSKARLLQRTSFELPVPAVAELAGRQPTTFRAVYDAGSDAYRFSFSGFPTAG